MFQGVQSIALAMAQEFGFTREIEDRVQAPCPIWLVAIAKVLSGAAQGVISAIIVLPMVWSCTRPACTPTWSSTGG